MSAVDEPYVTTVHLNAMHDFLTARDWILNRYVDSDKAGYPTAAEAWWDYPASYGCAAMNEIGNATPQTLTCQVHLGTRHVAFNIVSAGNYQGCPAHTIDETEFVVEHDGDLPFNEIAILLNNLEPSAANLDAKALIECRFFGPCGRQ